MLRATRLAVILSFATLLYNAAPASAQTLLGSSRSFAVLGSATVTNTGPSVIIGNLGVSPGTAITGFPPGTHTGIRHEADVVASQAHIDAQLAFDTLGGLPCTFTATGQELGGLTLVPGVYCFSSSAQLTGPLTLNAQGNPDAVFVFKMGSTLTTASSSSVIVINGGNHCNVYWHVGSSATLGTNTNFVGHILARASVTMTTGADLSGSAFALNGAVTLDSNNITVPVCGTGAGGGTGTGGIGTGGTVLSQPKFCATGSGEIAVPTPNNIKPSASGRGRATFSLDVRRNRAGGPVSGFFEYENPVQRLHVRGKITKIVILSSNSDGTPRTIVASGKCDNSVPQCVFAVTVAENQLGVTVTGAQKEVRTQRLVRNGFIHIE